MNELPYYITGEQTLFLKLNLKHTYLARHILRDNIMLIACFIILNDNYLFCL